MKLYLINIIYMQIFILNKKINYNWFWKQFEVDDNFFDNFPYNIENYIFEEIEWKLTWFFIQTEENKNFEKQKILSEYKNNLNIIKEINSEIQEVDETSQYFPEIAQARKQILETKRTELRNSNWLLVQQWISKYWELIISEL